MPAKAYRYYIVNEFPELEVGQSVTSTFQGTLLPSLVDQAPQTVIKYVGIADHENYVKYQVLHETYQSVVGRYMNEPIHTYVRKVEFHLFREAEQGILFADAKKQICGEMLRRLRDSEIVIDLVPSDIDLSKIGVDLKSTVSGGWFGDMRIANVSKMAAFGPIVGESEEWDRLDKMGELRMLDVHYEYENELFPMMIMPDRTIVLFARFAESEALGLLESIQAFLDGYVVQ